MLDPETLVYQLMLLGKPDGATLSADIDVDSIKQFPFVTYSVAGSGQTANGPGIWDVVLDLSVFGNGRVQAEATASSFYDLVHTWENEPGWALPRYGWVNGVADVSLFSRLASTDIDGRNVTQYAGSFALQLRN